MKGFKAYQINTVSGSVPACSRRDHHTIYLLSGQRQFQGADQESEPSATYLQLGNPSEGASLHWLPVCQMGYACLFTEAFVKESGFAGSQEPWSLLQGRGSRVFPLGDEQAAYLTGLFQKMLAEQESAYRFKHELLRSYLQLVLHEALRQPTPNRHFRYYFHDPDSPLKPGAGWRSRRGQ